MSNRISVEALSRRQSDVFWSNSPHASGFNRPEVLEKLSERVEWWGACRGQDVVAAWPVCSRADGDFRSPLFAYYVGPLLGGDIAGFKYHRYWAIQQQAFDALITHIAELYRDLRFSFPPGFTDLRRFEWRAGEGGNRMSFEAQMRHTAVVDNLTADDDILYQQMARNRKRDIAAIESNAPIMAVDWSIAEVIELHNTPLQRQGHEIAENRIRSLERILGVAKEPLGHVLAYREMENGPLASVVVMLYGRTDANNVLCVSTDSWRAQGLTAWTTFQGMKKARSDGLKRFDFNGANSPNRAADKHSYGATQRCYFNCRMQAIG